MSSQATSIAGKISRILVIQSGELPMVLRSLLAIRAIKQSYPDIKFTFLVKARFSAPVKRADAIDTVIEIPENLRSKDQLAPWIGQVLETQYDVVANWSFNTSGALISSMIPAMVRLGQYQEKDGSIFDCDAWTMYWNGLTNGAVPQDIHITDILTTQLLTSLQIHIGEPTAATANQPVRQVFKTLAHSLIPGWSQRTHGLKWIAINTSGWENQAREFVDQVLRRHPEFGFVQIGESGPDLSQERVVNLVNKVSFDQVLNVLSQVQWCVSLQPSVVDLASMMGIRILTCMNSKNNWSSTGPYGNGHLVLECESTPSASVLHAAFGYGASDWLHGGKKDFNIHLDQMGVREESKGVEFFRSRIRHGEEGGGVVYEKMQPHPTTLKEFSERAVSRAARAWFCGWVPPIDLELKRIVVSEGLTQKLAELKESIPVFRSLLDQGFASAADLESIAQKLRRPHLMDMQTKTDIEDLGKKLAEIEILMIRVATLQPALCGVTELYRSLMKSLPGDGLVEMAKQTKSAFSMIAEGLNLIEEMMNVAMDGQVVPKTKEKSRAHLRLLDSEL